MASANQSEILSKVGPGTKVGALFRSVWLPALLSSQLPSKGCAPVRLKLLGEELVAFRNGRSELGIVQANCAHRLAPLFYGRVEDAGIRCAYHGWLYDPNGQCLEMQNEPDKAVCAKVKIKSYKTAEKADVIWIFMGQGEPPALPKFPWMDLPKSQRNATVWIQESSWLQGMEGELDSSHVSILHTNPSTMATSPVHQKYSATDLSPKLYAKNTPIGILALARRNADEKFYWRVSSLCFRHSVPYRAPTSQSGGARTYRSTITIATLGISITSRRATCRRLSSITSAKGWPFRRTVNIGPSG
jgi:phenylpropionate dioxygenase-like ring-hydroxylating dioxygenase large terminal subunit